MEGKKSDVILQRNLKLLFDLVSRILHAICVGLSHVLESTSDSSLLVLFWVLGNRLGSHTIHTDKVGREKIHILYTEFDTLKSLPILIILKV